MVELGELERSHERFAERDVRVVVVSNDDQKAAQATQTRFPHLVVVSDAEQNVAKAMQVIHAGVGPDGEDTNAPTTFLVDGTGQVRWLFRSERFIARLSPDEVLKEIDRVQKGTRDVIRPAPDAAE
jgi:alkyl hydroperoxide reductase subunit AhpC